MKKLINYRMYISINGEGWKDTSVLNHVSYIEEEKCETWESEELTFYEALALVEDGFILNAECDYTFFTRKPRIKLSTSETFFEGPYYYTERTLKTLKIKKVYLPYDGPIKAIAALLPASKFCEYLKDHGVAYCFNYDKIKLNKYHQKKER